ELIVTTNRHHQKPARLKIMSCKRVNSKVRLPALRVENSIARGVRQIKTTSFTYAPVVIIKSRHYVLDHIAQLFVVTGEFFPVNSRAAFECRACEPGHDLRFAQKLL